MNETRFYPGRPSWRIAVALQCVPLLATFGCLVNGASSQNDKGLGFILWWSSLFWGLGYLYLGRAAGSRRIATLLGPILATGSCMAIYGGARVDFEHFQPTAANLANANRAAFEIALLIAAAVLLLAVDAWRLARSQEDAEAPSTPEADRPAAGGTPLREKHA